MKRLLILATCAVSTAAYALPTYEPFTEYASVIAASGSNAINLATGGYIAPSGETWTSLNFSGTVGTGIQGMDIYVTNASSATSVFTETALSSVLPSTFPGFPASGSAITTFAVNPAQPLVSPNIVGNSAVLTFSQDFSRPASGTKTLYVSYLFSVAQKGQTGAGNVGRYLGFLAATNLVEGTGTSGAYQSWTNLFNTFGTSSTSPKYFGHGAFNGAPEYIEPCDSSAGKNPATPPTTFSVSYNTPNFIVGEFVFTAGGSIKDTNILWVNPSLGSFGGATPPASPSVVNPLSITMSDVGGMVLIDRPGSGASGGVGTNYIANLIIGSTWSYVTGGPEFTNQPANLLAGFGDTVSLSAGAVAAGQSVTYQWQKIINGIPTSLTNGSGAAGGTAIASGSTSSTLYLTNVSAGDFGTFQVVATASGTGYTLTSSQAQIANMVFASSQPQSLTVDYSSNATFAASVLTTNATMTYAWYKGSTPITNGLQLGGSTASGAQGTSAGSSLTATLTLSNVSYLDDGTYTLFVTNNSNNNTLSTTPATLTVIDPFIVTEPPYDTVIPLAGSNALSVVAAGSGVTYQWYNNAGQLSNAGDISGVTTPTLTFSNAQSGDANTYYVIVSGSSGSQVQSSNAIVILGGNAQTNGPFSQTDWPASIAPNGGGTVDYAVFDPSVPFLYTAPADWNNVMSLPASSGDQTISLITIGGGTGYEATGTYFNFVDPNWSHWANVPVIDILLNVYGNGGMYDVNGNGLPTTWTEGTLTTGPNYAHAGTFPLGANNGQWNWMLLSVTNPIDGNSLRYVGDPAGATGTGQYDGVNNGTLRLEGFAAGMTIRAVALGPHGVFGASNQVDRFAAPAACAPEPAANLAYIDFNQGITNNLSVMNNANVGETYQVVSGVGPQDDLRTAIQSTSGIMEFPILNDYLGLPCNENLTMQLCIEFYDDPNMAGSYFVPYQYATDYQGDLATYTGSPYMLTGSGQWLKVAFYFGPANLQGVNTAPLTGGPTVYFNGYYPAIDRVELGVIRTGTNALAGQIPDPSYNMDPFVCSTNYGYYAEWNPNAGITNNLDIASGYSTALAGPNNDQRISEVAKYNGPAGVYYLEFGLLNSVFGPVLQDNADVVMTLTYYDDPAQAGAELLPNTYNTWVNGNQAVISPSAPYDTPVTLQGSGQWKDAQFELPNVNFYGAYMCRFNTYYADSGPIYVSRVRFDVIRPCGPFLGIDYLQSLGMTNANPNLELNWRGSAALQAAPAVTGMYASVANVTNTAVNIYTMPMTNNAQFFRLQFPAYPSYLSTNTP